MKNSITLPVESLCLACPPLTYKKHSGSLEVFQLTSLSYHIHNGCRQARNKQCSHPHQLSPLLESRGSWVWSQDSGDPVSQVGAGSLPGARTATVKVTLAWLRTQGCPRDPRSTSQQLTAPHTGGHLVTEVLELKCICKGNRHKKQKLLKYQKLKFPHFSKFHRKMSTMTAILDC